MKVAIIGGGASGLICAATLCKHNIQVDIFEKNEKLGKKIYATGNGRCNVFNKHKRDYVSLLSGLLYPNIIEKFDNRAFFEDYGVNIIEENEGRCYPASNQASSIVDALKSACGKNNVNIFCNCEISNILHKGKRYIIDEKSYDCVVIACGSKAGVKVCNAAELCKSINHTFSKTAPALVRMKTIPQINKNLHGVRAKAKVELLQDGKKIAEESGEIQFANGFLSGVCVMQLSLLASKLMCENKSVSVKIDFLPGLSQDDAVALMKNVKKNAPLASADLLLSGMLNNKLASQILIQCNVRHSDLCSQISTKQMTQIVYKAKNYTFNICGTDDYISSQVVLGGVPLSEIDSDTMQSKLKKNLFFCGEILDITGYCGGYNLNWAWCSGRAAAESIINIYDKNKRNKN